MVSRTFGSKIAINPSDFSVTGSFSLENVSANYNLFGSANKVVLSADRLLMEFPNLASGDSQLIYEVVEALHDCFADNFPIHNTSFGT